MMGVAVGHTRCMARGLEAVARNITAVAAEAGTERQLGEAISQHLGQLVPHDGFQLIGADPVARVGCLYTQRNCYSDEANRRLKIPQDFTGRRGTPLGRLMHGRPVELLGVGLPDPAPGEPVHEVMAAVGFGSELRIAFVQRGRVWGAMALLRERDSKPFSDQHTADAERLCGSLAAAVRRFVVAKPLRPATGGLAVGVLVIDQRLAVKAMTSSARDWLRKLSSDHAAVGEVLASRRLRSVVFATTRTGQPVVDTVPTPDGWVALQGELVDGGQPGEVAVTIQAASCRVLLPAAAAWHGLTPREQAVIERILDGLPVKQIAVRLGLSIHTVKDHLKAIYRKIGVNSRDELIAGLAG
jgi:DNA-binding CsgD family transcriptional regulator